VAFATKALLQALLPALDNLDLALEQLIDRLVEFHAVGLGAPGEDAKRRQLELNFVSTLRAKRAEVSPRYRC